MVTHFLGKGIDRGFGGHELIGGLVLHELGLRGDFGFVHCRKVAGGLGNLLALLGLFIVLSYDRAGFLPVWRVTIGLHRVSGVRGKFCEI